MGSLAGASSSAISIKLLMWNAGGNTLLGTGMDDLHKGHFI